MPLGLSQPAPHDHDGQRQLTQVRLTVDMREATSARTRERLLRSIFFHETGENHTSQFGGIPFAKLGIDWATPGDLRIPEALERLFRNDLNSHSGST